jgi:phage tail protein X
MSSYLDHVTTEGERWDQLAWRYYGDAMRISPLIRANIGLFGDGFGSIPAVLPAGLALKVRLLDPPPVPDALLPPWRRVAA